MILMLQILLILLKLMELGKQITNKSVNITAKQFTINGTIIGTVSLMEPKLLFKHHQELDLIDASKNFGLTISWNEIKNKPTIFH